MLIWATIVNAVWGVAGILSHSSLRTISTAPVFDYFGQQAGGLVFLSFALVAAWGILRPGLPGFILGLFQNATLQISLASALHAIYVGRYIELGAPTIPHAFILVDQIGIIVAAPLHLLSLSIYHGLAHAQYRANHEG